MILKVGLTGGIASGKSTVASTFARLGCRVLDADAVVAGLYQPGQRGHAALVREYGKEILDGNGFIDRPTLASIAFQTPEATARLNDLIHPMVIAAEEQLIAAEEGDVIYVVEATLLVESGGKKRYDRIVVVDIDPSLQIERAVGRGMNAEDVRRRMARQMRREERLAHADYVIDSSGEPAAVEEATRLIHQFLKRDLEAKKKRPAEAGR